MTNGSQASSTKWCAPAWSVPISISARPTRFALSTKPSDSICGQRIRTRRMAGPAALSESAAAPAGAAVSLRGVTKVYDSGLLALGPLDLGVRSGEFVSFLGPAGWAKSPALRRIAGLSVPPSAHVNVSHHSDQARAGHSSGFAIGFVF